MLPLQHVAVKVVLLGRRGERECCRAGVNMAFACRTRCECSNGALQGDPVVAAKVVLTHPGRL